MTALRLKRHAFHADWNYTLSPFHRVANLRFPVHFGKFMRTRPPMATASQVNRCRQR